MQVIYNIFEQEPADELLPAALEHNVGILVRVVFDEGYPHRQIHGQQRIPRRRFP